MTSPLRKRSRDSERRAAFREGQLTIFGKQAKRYVSGEERDAFRARADSALKLSGKWIDKSTAFAMRADGATYARIALEYHTTISMVSKFFKRHGDATPEMRRILAKRKPSRNDVLFKAFVALCGGHPAKVMAEQEAQIRRDFAELVRDGLRTNGFGVAELSRRVNYSSRTIWRYLNEPTTSGSFPVNKMAKIAVALGCRLHLSFDPLPEGDWKAWKSYVDLLVRREEDPTLIPKQESE